MADISAEAGPTGARDAQTTGAGAKAGPMLAADGTPLKKSLARALRVQKLRALMLIAPLLLFILITFVAPIADMLFRSVENNIVANTLQRTVPALAQFDPDAQETPGAPVFEDLYYDMFLAAEAKEHTRLGTRLNYEETGMSSLFRSTGRGVDDIGEDQIDALEDLGKHWEDEAFWFALMTGGEGASGTEAPLDLARARLKTLTGDYFYGDMGFVPGAEITNLLPATVNEYAAFAGFTVFAEEDVVAEEEPWEAVKVTLIGDLQSGVDLSSYTGPGASELREAQAALQALPPVDFQAGFLDIDEDWGANATWRVIKVYSPTVTTGYFLNAIDMQKGVDGIEPRPENQQIYIMLFQRTLVMSLIITVSCILLGYPIAWILANLPTRQANLLLILVLLPFWTSLLVRTSAWKVMLQQQGVVNDVLVWLGMVADDSRLIMMNNQTGTIIAMTHILLPFMILPMYSVMQTIPPTYLRAAKSLGATNWTAFWRVYFPQSVPGIGAGSILVFILAIGYYITPEIVGGTTGTFISNRIAYHISSSLNWGLAAALGSILLGAVLILYWAYDKIVGIDNVKLG